MIAIVTDLAIGIGGIIYVRNDDKEAMIKAISFSMRNVHIALDTIVLYTALGVTAIELNIGPSSSQEARDIIASGRQASVAGGNGNKRSAFRGAHGSGQRAGRGARSSHVSRMSSPDVAPLPV